MLKKAIFLSLFAFAFVTSASAAITPTPAADLRKDSEGCYLIGNADELYGFAAMVNAEKYGDYSNPVFSSCVKLEDDITVNSDLLGSNGYPGSGSFEKWTPIQRFNGSFDGQGHVISGLFADVSSNEDADVGFIAEVNAKSSSSAAASISNLGIEDSYFSGKNNAGAFVARVTSYGASLTISNCYTKSRVVAGTYATHGVGGFVGTSDNGTYVELYNNVYSGYLAWRSSNASHDLFVGKPYSSSYGNNFFTTSNSGAGSYATSEDVTSGQLAYRLHSYKQNGVDGSIWGQDVEAGDVYPNFSGKLNGISGLYKLTYYVSGVAVKEEMIPSWTWTELARSIDGYLIDEWYDNAELNGSSIEYIDEGITQNVNVYTGGTAITEPVKNKGCYEIASASDLYGFAAIVNGTFADNRDAESNACGKLVDNIKLNENVLGSDGFVNNAAFTKWIPIGTEYSPFVGSFDGQGYKISGLYFKGKKRQILSKPAALSQMSVAKAPAMNRAPSYADLNNENVGLFGTIAGGSGNVYIQNLRIEDSFLENGENVGVLVGSVAGNLTLTVKNVKTSATVYSEENDVVGGLIGLVQDGATVNIQNSFGDGHSVARYGVGGLIGLVRDASVSIVNGYFSGVVGGSGDYYGCMIGMVNSSNVQLLNSYVACQFVAGNSNEFVGAFAGNVSSSKFSVENAFYLNSLNSDYGTPVSRSQLEQGVVATLLHDYEGEYSGSVWGQTVETDALPNFSGKVVGATIKKSAITYRLSNGTSVSDSYIEGFEKILPMNTDGNIVTGWYTSDSYSEKVTSILASETGDKIFYGKVKVLAYKNGCYEIGSVDALYEFADLVNNGNGKDVYCGKLVSDIEINKNLVKGDGSLNGEISDFRRFTPIGYYHSFGTTSEGDSFRGIFDGQGHTISGLLVVGPASYDVGLFGYIKDAEIKNLGIINSYVEGDYAGAFVGCSTPNWTTEANVLENVFIRNTTVAGGFTAGGLVGINHGNLVVSKSSSDGYVLTESLKGYNTNHFSGGLVGTNTNMGTITIANSYSVSTVKGIVAGGMVGKEQGGDINVTFSYAIGNIVGTDSVDVIIGSNTAPSSTISAEAVLGVEGMTNKYDAGLASTAAFEKGFIAVLLNEVNPIWGQDVTGGDKHPNFSGVVTGASVFSQLYLVGYYGYYFPYYEEGVENVLPEGFAPMGYRFKGWYDNEDFNGEPITVIPASATGSKTVYAKFESMIGEDGCFEIASADDLYQFAYMVKTNRELCGKLMDNIVVNSNVLKNGELNGDGSNFVVWDPIGDFNYGPYAGVFDGQGFTISGLYYNNENVSNIGLFGFVQYGTIKNLGVVDSYFKGSSNVAGLIGFTSAGVVIENSYSAALVEGNYQIGGLMGYFAGGESFTILNSYNEGTVKGLSYNTYAGGIIGYASSCGQAILTNVYNVGSVYGYDDLGGMMGYSGAYETTFKNVFNAGTIVSRKNDARYVASFVGDGSGSNPPTAVNAYYLDGDYSAGSQYIPISGAVATSAEDFADGTVAMALRGDDKNSIWGQNVAKGDKYPNFSGKVVKTEIALDWDNASETVTIDASKVDEFTEVIVEPGKEFYYNGVIYKDTLNLAQIEEIDGKQLKPISGVALETAGDDTQAELSGSTETDKLIVPVEIRVAHIDIEREFKGTNSTLMVPFNVDNVDTNVLKLIEVDTVYKDMELNAWVAEGTRVESIKAHTPYIINYTGRLSFDDVELVPNVSADTKVSFGNWTFVGAYEGKTWLADDPELGKAYGFSGVAKEGIAQGQFVRIGVNAKIAPMRAYLLYEKKDEAPAVAPKPDPDATTAVAAGESLPSSIILRVVDRKKDVVEEIIIDDVIQGLVGETQKSVEEKPVRWYDLKGRRLNSKPTARGTYIKNNKAVLNK